MDKATVDYFDSYVPVYGNERLEYAVSIIEKLAHKDSTLVDIGCGTGNILEYIAGKTPVKKLYGVDVSQNCLNMIENKIECKTFCGSVVDDNFVNSIEEKFDFAILSAILHHIVGKSRTESRNLEMKAIFNAVKLLKTGGWLIINEPIFHPAFMMSILFYIKTFLTKFTSGRINILGEWNNIGAPVVYFFTNKQFFNFLSKLNNCEIIDKNINKLKLPFLLHLAMIHNRTETTVILRKTE